MKQLNSFFSCFYSIQAFMLLVGVIIGFLLKDGKIAISIFFGGIAAIIPSIVFACKLFSCRYPSQSKQIVQNFYMGEALKILVSVVIFCVIFNVLTIEPLTFFLSYIAVLVTGGFFFPVFQYNKDYLR